MLIPRVEGRPTEEEIETAPIFLIEAVHCLPCGADAGPSLLVERRTAVRKIRQNAESQLRTRVPVGQTVALQEGGQMPAAVRSGEQPHNDAQRPSLRRQSLWQLHPGHRTGRNQTQKQKIQGVFHQIRDRKEQKCGGPQGSGERKKPQGSGQGESHQD